MASKYWGASPGDHEKDVSEGSSSTGDVVQLVFDKTSTLSRKGALILLETIIQRVHKEDWPPA